MKAQFLILLALGIGLGASVTSQSGVNAQLRARLNSPLQAALISFLVGTVALVIINLAHSRDWPSLRALSNIPVWAWCGGLLGAFNITAAVILAPRLGALSLTVTVVCGQLLTSLLLDHYGLLGFPRYPVSGNRLFGAILLVLGLLLTSRR